MSKQLQLLKQELKVSQILRIYGKHFRQISEMYSGRCAIGVLMSYFGWMVKTIIMQQVDYLLTIGQLKYAGIDEDLLINLNDSGYSFDEIAEYLDIIDK